MHGTLQCRALPFEHADTAILGAGGTGCAYALIAVFCSLGYIPCPPTRLLGTVCLAAAAATCTEALPISQKLDDNISVPGVAALTATLLLHQGL